MHFSLKAYPFNDYKAIYWYKPEYFMLSITKYIWRAAYKRTSLTLSLHSFSDIGNMYLNTVYV